MLDLLAQQIINGIMAGCVYALIALGFTLVFGVLGLVNMAHADLVMIGAFAGAIALTSLHMPFVVALVIGAGAAAVFGIAIERVALRPLAGTGGILAPLIATIGVSIILQNAATLTLGSQARFVPTVLPEGSISAGGVSVSIVQLVVVAVTLAMAGGLTVLIAFTRMGRAIRATAENRDVAALLGVNTRAIVVRTVAIASALAGIAGVLVCQMFNSAYPYMGIDYGVKGLIVMIVGGIRSIEGAIVIGFFLGISEALVGGYVSSVFRDAVAFGLLMVVLVVRPRGLFPPKFQGRA